MPRISVVVPHYNDLIGLDHCLTALAAQTLPREAFEIIVADNASPVSRDALDATVAGRARLTIVDRPGAGPARTWGRAGSRQCPCLHRLDRVAEPGWLEAGEHALADYDFVGGRMIVSNPEGLSNAGVVGFEKLFAFDNEAYVRNKGFTVTANLFCKRSVFDATGPFRTGVSEDTEWCERATANGFQLGYAPSATVGHPARANWAQLIKKWRRLQAESFEFARETPGGGMRWVLRQMAMPLSIPVHALRVMRSPILHGSRQRIAVLSTLTQLRLWRFFDGFARLLGRR